MKINGQTLQRDYSRQVELPRPDGSSVMLRLQPLPLGFHRQVKKQGILAPLPPARIARDSSGRPLRDERGVAIMLEDEHDKTFLEEWELYHQRLAVLIVAKALEVDPTVEFETVHPNQLDDWTEYADELYAELEAAGFSAGDLIYLCEEVCRMSNLAGEHLSQATTDFIPQSNR